MAGSGWKIGAVLVAGMLGCVLAGGTLSSGAGDVWLRFNPDPGALRPRFRVLVMNPFRDKSAEAFADTQLRALPSLDSIDGRLLERERQ